jgi:hypothetical protein
MGDGLRARPCPLHRSECPKRTLGISGGRPRGWRTGHDSIKVGRAAGGYHAIQLRISGGAINFERVIVRYGNGEKEEIPIRARIPAGGQTRVIDLPGRERIIQSLDLWYSKDRWEKRPKASLYGLN